MKKFSIVLIVIGILLVVLPIIGSIYTKVIQNQRYNDYLEKDKTIEKNIATLSRTLEDHNIEKQKENENNKTLIENNGVVEEGKILGELSIPKIQVEVLVTEGVRKEDLKYGVGHMPGTAFPGQKGNCAIAGHRSYTFGEYFNQLDKIEKGDEIYVTIDNITYTYEVTTIFRVKPEDLSVLEQDDKVKMITLITCDPIIHPTHRLIVQGTLK